MANKKHILIITYNDYPAYEGLGVRIKNMARVFIENGHQVTIYAPNIEYKRIKSEPFEGGRIIRTTVWTPDFFKKNRVIARGWSMVVQFLRTPVVYLKHLRNSRIDLILAEHIYSVPSAIVVRAFTGPAIFVDDIITVSDALRDAGFPRLVRLFTWFEKTLFRFCRDFIYTSALSYQYYKKRGAEPTLYVPNGVNCDEFIPVDTPKDAITIFFNGSAYSAQNNEAAANFIGIGKKVIEKVGSGIRFRLVCWPAYNLLPAVQNDLKNAGQWLSYEDGVEDIATEIGNADIALLPYSRGHNLTGGTRLKALEYMACGKPVIATPEGVEGITGLVPDEHFLLAESIEQFPRIIAQALRAPDDMKRIARNARAFVLDHYDWRKTMAELISKLDSD